MQNSLLERAGFLFLVVGSKSIESGRCWWRCHGKKNVTQCHGKTVWLPCGDTWGASKCADAGKKQVVAPCLPYSLVLQFSVFLFFQNGRSWWHNKSRPTTSRLMRAKTCTESIVWCRASAKGWIFMQGSHLDSWSRRVCYCAEQGSDQAQRLWTGSRRFCALAEETGRRLYALQHQNRRLIRSATQIPDFTFKLGNHAAEFPLADPRNPWRALDKLCRGLGWIPRTPLTDVLTDSEGVVHVALDLHVHYGA